MHVIRAHIVVAMEWVAVSESVGWSVAVAKFSRWQNGDTASAVRGREAASERANKRGRELPIKAADGRKEGGREGRTGLALALVAARTSPSVPRKKTASSSLADFALFEFDGRAAAATDGRREGEGAPVPPARARSSCTSWRRLARRRRRSRPGRPPARPPGERLRCAAAFVASAAFILVRLLNGLKPLSLSLNNFDIHARPNGRACYGGRARGVGAWCRRRRR